MISLKYIRFQKKRTLLRERRRPAIPHKMGRQLQSAHDTHLSMALARCAYTVLMFKKKKNKNTVLIRYILL